MNTRQTKLSDDEYPLVPVSNGREVPLLTLVDQLTDGRLQIPPHQRTARQWDSRKKSSFIRRIQDGRQCIGCILTYQIGGRGIVYLNDGLQRLSTAREYLDNPLQYGDSIEKARDRLNCYSMVIQHRHYRNHDEALLDFQEINQGSHLTAFQFARGVLTYMKDYELYWKPFFEDLHLVLTRQPVLLAKQRGGTTQESRDAYKRNDYALFYRFATGEKSLIRYWSGRKKLSASDVEDKSVLEWKLRIWCESTGIDIARKLLKRFEVMVTEETQLIMTLWKKEEHQGKGIATLLYRGLLDIGIWRRNNDLPYDKWEDFVKKVLANSQDRMGTCWKCGLPLAEIYPAANGTPGFYVCDTPGCSENYAENCAREARLDDMDCKHCAYWIQDNTDAIGMGYCNNPQSLRGLTAYSEWCSDFRERSSMASSSSLLGKLVYLDGEMPVVVLEFGGDDEARVLHEDTGRTWWVYISRLIRCPADGRQPHAQRT